MRVFQYIELAISIAEAVPAVIAAVSVKPVTGASILVAVSPSLAALQAVVPSINIPAALETDIANAVADAINGFEK